MARTRLPICVLVLFAGCGSGDVRVTIYGEDYIEQRIPPGSEDEGGFVDGWSFSISKFLVVLSDVQIGGAAQASETFLLDVHRPGPTEVHRFAAVPSGTHPFSFTIAPANGAPSRLHTTDADEAVMTSGGYSVYVEGTATRGAEQRTVRWGFDTATRYAACATAETGPGVTVSAGSEVTAQITVHGDHLFHDQLTPDAQVRFGPIAEADADGDGEVTLDELGAVPLSSLPLDLYGTGGTPNVTTLRDFVTAQVRSLGHFQGEGHCQVTPI